MDKLKMTEEKAALIIKGIKEAIKPLLKGVHMPYDTETNLHIKDVHLTEIAKVAIAAMKSCGQALQASPVKESLTTGFVGKADGVNDALNGLIEQARLQAAWEDSYEHHNAADVLRKMADSLERQQREISVNEIKLDSRERITDIICDALNAYGLTEESNYYKAEIIYGKIRPYLAWHEAPMDEKSRDEDLSNRLMNLAELLGNFPEAKINEKTWKHLLVYAPKREISDWQPIETRPESGRYWMGAIDGNGDDAVYRNHDWRLRIKPTHWMPETHLPPLPCPINRTEEKVTIEAMGISELSAAIGKTMEPATREDAEAEIPANGALSDCSEAHYQWFNKTYGDRFVDESPYKISLAAWRAAWDHNLPSIDDVKGIMRPEAPATNAAATGCREEFEKKITPPYEIARREDGHYANRDTEAAWCGWQACWQIRQDGLSIEAFLIALGSPHLKTAFRGDGIDGKPPTDEQVAREIGSAIMQVHLGLAEECEDEDDGDLSRETPLPKEVGIGGNHLASALLAEDIYPDSERQTSYDEFLRRYGQPWADIFVAWKAITDWRDGHLTREIANDTLWSERARHWERMAKKLREALKLQHQWHLSRGEEEFNGVKVDMVAEYCDSTMYEKTVDALNETESPKP